MDTLGFAERTLERQLNWVRTADTKVAPVFAVDAAMLSLLGVRLPEVHQFAVLPAIVWALAVASLVASLVFLGLVAFPRLDGPRESLVFFGTVAKMDADKYVARLLAGDDNEVPPN